MTEINIVEIILGLVLIAVLVVNSRVSKVVRATDEDRSMLCLLLKDSLKSKVEEMSKMLEKRNETKIKNNGKGKHKN